MKCWNVWDPSLGLPDAEIAIWNTESVVIVEKGFSCAVLT